ncbi:MAG: hypothetical protein Q4Q00_05090, partial [Turicibacter sp.]|nr:hypothetical protein [Turicibacter sp.]
MNDITIKVATIEDISAIISFEKEARQTEPGVLYWDVDEKEYSAKLINLDIDHLENSKIIIAKQNQKVILLMCSFQEIFSIRCKYTYPMQFSNLQK